MAKSKNIQLNLTPETEIAQTLFDDWRQSIDGYNGENAVNPSNFEIIDSEIGRINEVLATVSTLKFEVVQTLPPISEAKDNVIYLVPASESGEANYYEEYIFLPDRNEYELIGSTQITFDDVPTEGSQNAVKSGGVYSKLQEKQNVINDLDTIRSGAAKGETAVQPNDLSTVATTGSYDDLTDKPDLSIYAETKDLAEVATSGSYNDLLDKPDIPASQVQSDWNQTDDTAPDFIKNKPDVPSGQVQSDWTEEDTTSVTYIKNKPNIEEIVEEAISDEQSRAITVETELGTRIDDLGITTENILDDLADEQSRAIAVETELESDLEELNEKVDNLPIPEVNNPTITFTQGGSQKGQITLNQSDNQTIEFDGGQAIEYTAGNGINITEDNIINADVKAIHVKSVVNLTPEQCNSLNVGDSVCVYFSGTRPVECLYTVIYKDDGMSEDPTGERLILSRITDNHSFEYVYYIRNSSGDYLYDHIDEQWLPDNTDPVLVSNMTGTLTNEQITTILDTHVIRFERIDETEGLSFDLYASKWYQKPTEESFDITLEFSSTLDSEGNYYVATITPILSQPVEEEAPSEISEEEDQPVATYEIVKKSGGDLDITPLELSQIIAQEANNTFNTYVENYQDGVIIDLGNATVDEENIGEFDEETSPAEYNEFTNNIDL